MSRAANEKRDNWKQRIAAVLSHPAPFTGKVSAPEAMTEGGPSLLSIAQRLIQWDQDFPAGSFINTGLKELDHIIADARIAVEIATSEVSL